MRKFLLTLIATVACFTAFCQDFSNKGKDFFLCFPSHVPSGASLAQMSLFITSDKNSSGVVTYNGITTNFTVTQNTVTEVPIVRNNAYITDAESNSAVNKGIRVRTNPGQPAVVVYSHIYAGFRTAATLVLPVNVLGRRYRAVSYFQTSTGNSKSQFQIVAVDTNTVVEIQRWRNGALSGTPFQVTLPNVGDVYQIQDDQDMTGTSIESVASGTSTCKKIAVFSGSSALSLSRAGCNGNSFDPLNQQCYPVTSWGKKFGVIPIVNNPRGYQVRVMASENNTTVDFAGNIVTLNAGEVYPPIASNVTAETNPIFISADKPVAVSQYLLSQTCASPAGNIGDPDMIVLNPVEQNISNITIFTSTQQSIQQQHMNVLIKTAGAPSFRIIDQAGNTVPINAFTPMPADPTYSYLQHTFTNVAQASYTLRADSGFNAICYGLGGAESYGYSAGTNVKDLYQQVSVASQFGIESTPSACLGSPFKFKISLPYRPDSLFWDFNGLPAGSPVANVMMNGPVTPLIPDSTTLVNGVTIYWYSLPNIYTYNTIGVFPVSITAYKSNTDGCGNTQDIDFELDVSAPPVSDFNWTNNGCVTDTVRFTNTSVTTKPTYKWWWDFGDPASGVNNNSTSQNPGHLFSAPGTYTVRFATITTPGCLSDTATRQVTVTAVPSAKFGMSSPICADKPVTFSDTSVAFAPGTLAKWNWNFGDGFSIVRTNGTDTTHIYSPWNASITATLSVETNSGCRSPVFSRTFKVHPNPVANFNMPAGICLPSGTGQFTSTSTLADGTIGTASYLWNFGDPGSGAANSSTLQNPTHFYTGTGPFSINLQVTSLAGCVHDSTKVLSTVYAQAQAAFAQPAAVCLGTPTSFTSSSNPLAGNTIQTYQWDFGEPASGANNSSTLANPTHTYLTAGTFTVRHWIVTDKNCNSDTATQTVTVNVVPAITNVAATGPTTCGGSEGTITLSGLLPGQTYTVNYSKNAAAQPPLSLTANAGGNIVITGLGAGTYTNINCTANNCTSTNAPAQVLSDPPLPATPATGSNGPICSGSTLNLSTAPVANATYAWTGPNGFASALQNPTIPNATTAATGVYLLAVTVNNCTSLPSAPLNVVVNLLPAITNTVPVNPSTCGGANGTITLSGLTPGQTYTVNYRKNAVAQPVLSLTADAAGNVVITGLTAGTYTNINCTANNCTSADAPIQVLNDPAAPFPPTAGSNSPICAGAALTLNTPALANATYSWTGPNGFTSTSQNPVINNAAVAASGSYSITVTVNNCTSGATSVPVVVNALPAANFSNSTPVCETKSISFTDLSVPNSGALNSWQWNFGDPASGAANTSSLQNPSHTYATPGSYTVSLTATTDVGCTSPVFTRPVVISPQPVPGFILPEVCLSDAFALFTDTSKVAGGTITGWLWNFGDPASGPLNTSTAQNAQHKYNAVGNYTVTLTVTTNNGCTETISQPITINGDIPVSNFTPLNPATMCANDSISIQDASTVNFGSITKVEIYWDNAGAPGVFDVDDTPTPGKIYKHKYPNFQSPLTRTYNIRYRAYSGGTCVNDRIRPVIINAAPAVQFTAMPPACLDAAPFQITQATETGGVPGTGVFTGPGINASGIFDPAAAGVGVHTIRYTYTSTAGGCVDFKEQTIEVLTPPTADFNFAGPACETQSVTFTSTSAPAPGTGTLTTWTWDFGDLSPVVVRNNGGPVTHTYAATGNFTATLRVTTSNGCNSAVKSVVVPVNPLPQVDFGMPKVCLPNANATFTDLSTIADGTQNAFTYSWNFGDPASGINNTSVAKNASHIYTSAGPFTVTLRVTSGAGCVSQQAKLYTDIHEQPVADFIVSDADGVCINDVISFADNSDYKDGTPVSWFWSLGDGSTRTTQNINNYLYGAARTYDVKLYVENSQGCKSDTAVKQFTVHPYPVVDAGPDRFVLEGGTITLEPNVTGNDLQYLWTPGTYLDNPRSGKPVFQAGEDMTYTLLVTSRGGCSGSDRVFVKVLKMPQIPNTFSPNNDGINDFWTIDYLNTYPSNRVQVFTRTGQLVFESRGYNKPWNGTMNGKPLPFDTYYYIIEPGNGRKPLTGYVTIVK